MGEVLVCAATRFAAVHHWPDAPDAVAYLRDPHRHEFHVRAWAPVTHLDRAVEVIDLKLRLGEALAILAGPERDFGSLSCEMIADHLRRFLECRACEVLEDGENGAVVIG